MYVAALAIVRSQLDSGKAKVIALTNRERAVIIPDVPTAIEAGFPALTLEGLVGLFGPRDIASNVRERIAADVGAIAADPTIRERLAATGQVVNAGTPADFAASIEEQRSAIALAAKELGLTSAQ